MTPAPLSLESGSVETKTYDGQSSAVVESVSFAGLKNGEALSEDIDYSATAEFANAAAGPDKEAMITVALEKNDKKLKLFQL
ncbi:YDG domain-containing protein [Eubacterium limosum]|uniref:YDG domain-containing protein n=1 Tax=Eubacterium limosum TaxID=1736 RepID=UPI001D087BA9|nr:YDG domain-containing protein [Eubacterium limosum]